MKISKWKLFLPNSKVSIVFLLPSIIAALGIFLKIATGPYWLAANQDPSYQYLINSLMILDHKTPNLVDNPGTPLQLLGAVIIALLKPGFSKEKIIEDVISRPEFFLNVIHACLLLLFVVSLAGLGYYAFRKTQNLLFAMLLQLPALLFVVLPTNSYEQYTMTALCNVSPEVLLLTIGNFFTACLLILYFETRYEKSLLFAVVWGVVCGLGAATKMTFLPLWLLPVIVMPRFWDKALVFMCSISSFLVFTIPIMSRYPDVFHWFKKIVVHTGEYGAGAVGIISAGQFLKQLNGLIQDNVYFFLMTAACLGFLVFRAGYHLTKPRHSHGDVKRPVWFLFAVTTVSVLQILMVAKHPSSHYLLPAMGLVGFQLAMIYQSAGGGTHLILGKGAPVFLIITIAIFVAAGINYQRHLNQTSQAALAFSKKIFSDYRGCIIFSYSRSSSMEFALNFANEWDWMYPFCEILQQKYPTSVFYSRGRFIFNSFQRQLSLDNLKGLQAAGHCLLLFGTPSDFVYGFLGVEEIESAGKEKVYKIRFIPSSEAVGEYLMAKDFENKKDYRAAYACALNARQAGLPGMEGYAGRLKRLAFPKPIKNNR